MTPTHKTIIASASIGAAGLFCLQKAKQLMIENVMLKQHLRQRMAAEEEIKQQIAGQLAGKLEAGDGATFGFARALAEESLD